MPFHSADRVPERLRLWSLSEDVLVESAPTEDQLVALTQWGEIPIDDTSPLVRESLQRMTLGPVSVENLPAPGQIPASAAGAGREAGARDRPLQGWERLHRVLDRLGCCVVQSLGLADEVGAGPLLSVVPVSRHARFWLPPAVDPARPIRLSRFVAMRASDGELLVESPLSQYRVALHRPLAAWVAGSLAAPTTVTGLAEQLHLAAPVVLDVVAYLVASGMVLVAEPDLPVRFAEDSDTDLVPWSQRDLMFHAHSRMGRHSGPSGAVFPYLGRLPAAPVTRPRPPGPRYPLHRPVLADLIATDPPLTEVIEVPERAEHYSDAPLTAEQVGELLFRVARVRSTRLASSALGATYDVSDRPYPSTAGLYELELYLSVDRCVGLPRGSYHYDPSEHELTLVSGSEPELGELLDVAKVGAGSTLRPPVLITVSTRIARLSWMYGGTAYATTRTNVGVLQQTLHLVATAMGLASYGLPMGDGTVSDSALQLDWPSEVSVGEFVVGVP
jgi:SagB-type dehydrogenase family enzyme